MKKQLLVSAMSGALVMGALSVPMVASAGWSANVGMVTDYRFRGMSQNDETIALQGGFDYAWDNGFYVGTWASSLDWQDQGAGTNGNNTSLEVDLYGGYGSDIGDSGFSYDVGVLNYIYPNQSNANPDYNTTEIYGSLSYGMFTASIAHSPSMDFLNADDSNYISLAVDHEFDNGVGVGASWGTFDIDEKRGVADMDYNDWKIYVAKSYAGFDFELSYVDTDEDGTCNNSTGPFQCDSTAVFSVSKSWE